MTKKMLVPYSIEKNSTIGKSFVAPVGCAEGKKFISLNDQTKVKYAMVVYLGREVSSEDVFAKILNIGMKIVPSVDAQIGMIEEYFEKISIFKVGDIVNIGFDLNENMEISKEIKIKNYYLIENKRG